MTDKVEKDISDLFGKTNRLDRKLAEVEVSLKHYTDVLEAAVESDNKLVETLQSMQITFVKMDGKIDEMSKDIISTKNQVNGIDCRMKKIEDDSRFEIMGFLKKQFPWIVVGLGMLIYWLSKYIKF